jgi:hypothetical protein
MPHRSFSLNVERDASASAASYVGSSSGACPLGGVPFVIFQHLMVKMKTTLSPRTITVPILRATALLQSLPFVQDEIHVYIVTLQLSAEALHVY